MRERRKFPRVDLEVKAIWRGADSLDNLDQTRNISEGGVCFELSKEYPQVGDIVQLVFSLPRGRIIHSKAQVRWVSRLKPGQNSWQAGLEFSNISDLDRQEIRQFVGECRYGCD